MPVARPTRPVGPGASRSLGGEPQTRLELRLACQVWVRCAHSQADSPATAHPTEGASCQLQIEKSPPSCDRPRDGPAGRGLLANKEVLNAATYACR